MVCKTNPCAFAYLTNKHALELLLYYNSPSVLWEQVTLSYHIIAWAAKEFKTLDASMRHERPV